MAHLQTAGTDRVRRFIFESQPVRGHWVQLRSAWRDLRSHARYPQPVERLLGEAVAAVVLLAASLKFQGALTFQLQGNGIVRLLVAQCTHDFRLRALARYDEAALGALTAGVPEGALFRGLVGSGGRLTVTIEADEKGARYQGVVPLEGGSLAESLEAYFASSEQLPTRVLLAADAAGGAGLLVQKLPGAGEVSQEESSAAWRGAQRGVAGLKAAELLECPVEELLARGFPDYDLRLFRGAPVRFECRCGEGRVAGLLRALGAEEVRDVLREQGSVTVTCEFCSRPYRFDAAAVEALFPEGHQPQSGSPEIH
ncbi:MAG TPA: Hsp33 family molecular chaperone HslO [Steroidobacteraceae bacterium]|nr:Hsp33 family molecular chaperone HslO [Steroidobacteraceae bacterium]